MSTQRKTVCKQSAFIVAANMAHWFGSSQTALYLAPFAAMFGGLAQFLAGMWSFKARDGLASAMHGMWGSFWLAYGLLSILFVTGTLAKPTGKLISIEGDPASPVSHGHL